MLAILIPVLIGLGWYMLSVEDTPGSESLFALHVSLGLTAALLIALRLTWRLRNRPEPLASAIIPAWQSHAARATHVLMYLLLVAMPITGYLGASFSGETVAYFGIALPSWASKNTGLKEQLFNAHSLIAWVLVAAIGLHVLAALKHLLIDQDGVFLRMWPR